MNRLGNWISGKSQTPFYARREFNIKKQVIRVGQIMTKRFNM